MNHIPSGRTMGLNRTNAEIVKQANELTATSHSIRDKIIENANAALAEPGITEQIKSEITSYIFYANCKSDTVGAMIDDAVRIACEHAL